MKTQKPVIDLLSEQRAQSETEKTASCKGLEEAQNNPCPGVL